ncbi:DUF7261 family protein [Halovenus salina]|uniref:DUF7261 family protein n=1 Tax=Halovenus salina TaxID=1510225 RepID=UPI002260FD09|nr:hypothetical protein [Halovenus salina]
MADIGDRSQLLLVTAFLLAVSFVVLALVVNSAIYTENIATRDDVAGSHEALEYRAELQQSVGAVLTAVNKNSTLTQTEFNATVDSLSSAGAVLQSTQGRLVNTAVSNIEDGTRIAQTNASRNFTSVGGKQEWILTDSNVESVRNLRLNISDPGTSQFSLVANDTDTSDADWRLQVVENGSDQIDVVVTVDGGPNRQCVRDHDGSTVIDVTAATVAGKPCLALGQLQDNTGTTQWIGANIGDSFRLEFENADAVTGRYSAIIGPAGSANTTALQTSQQSDEPFAVGAIYSATVDYAFYTSAVGYETKIRVAPEEVPP